MPGNPTLPTENIDEVILGLLSLEPNEVDELDYESYKSYLRELLVEVTSGKRKIDSGETENIKNEFKRVRGKKGRFRIKKTKITASSLGLGRIRKQVKGTQQRMMLMPAKDDLKQPEVVSKGKGSDLDILNRISATLDSIIETLTNINKENKNRIERQRKDAETKRRGAKEKELESKPFEGIKRVVSAIIKPFQSIWDRIVNFITNIILGRIVLKIIDWFADQKNQKKIQSLIRFFKDHWPILLAAYLRFGTGIGRFIGKLSGVLIKGSLRLIQITANLAARMGLKGAGKVGRFLGGRGGKLLSAGLAIGADVAMTAGAAGVVSGDIKVPGFSGGGWNKGFGNLFGGAKNFFGNMFSGLVKGPKGRDKVPAMLTDGEFVMSAGAVRKYGVDTLESMNASGGGTNIPKISDGMTFAFGGGFIGDEDLRRMAAKESSPTGGVAGSREYIYDPNNSHHVNNYEKLKKIAIKKGVYKPPTGVKSNTYTSPNVKTNVDVNVDAKPSTSITRPTSQGTPRGGALSTDIITSRPKVRGYGGALQAAFAAMEFVDRKNQGQTNAQAGLGAAGSTLGGSIGWMAGAKAGALIGGGIGALFGGVGAAPGAAVGAIIGGLAGGFGGASLGGKFADDLSGVNAIKERMGRGGVGGAIKGGYGLKDQSFKGAPKTMVMTDDKGRPFVGHKAMKNGRLTYVKPSKPGTGTTNPLEMLGRAINPGAYKDSDARLAMKNQKIAMVNALENFQQRGMSKDAQARMMKQMGGNLKDVQNDLNYRRIITQKEKEEQKKLMSGNDKMSVMRRNNVARIAAQQKKSPSVKPLVRARPKPFGTGGGGLSKPRGGSKPTSATKPPSFSPTHHKGTATAQAALGVNKKK